MSFPTHLESPEARTCREASYKLRAEGYTHLADKLDTLAERLQAEWIAARGCQ